MKKTIKLIDLDCGHCADKIQNAVKKIDGVTNVSVNFLGQKMVLEAPDDRFDAVLAEAKALIKKIEPDVTVKRKEKLDTGCRFLVAGVFTSRRRKSSHTAFPAMKGDINYDKKTKALAHTHYCGGSAVPCRQPAPSSRIYRDGRVSCLLCGCRMGYCMESNHEHLERTGV